MNSSLIGCADDLENDNRFANRVAKTFFWNFCCIFFVTFNAISQYYTLNTSLCYKSAEEWIPATIALSSM